MHENMSMHSCRDTKICSGTANSTRKTCKMDGCGSVIDDSEALQIISTLAALITLTMGS